MATATPATVVLIDDPAAVKAIAARANALYEQGLRDEALLREMGVPIEDGELLEPISTPEELRGYFASRRDSASRNTQGPAGT